MSAESPFSSPGSADDSGRPEDKSRKFRLALESVLSAPVGEGESPVERLFENLENRKNDRSGKISGETGELIGDITVIQNRNFRHINRMMEMLENHENPF